MVGSTERKPVRILARVQANAKKNEVLRFQEGILYLKIAAPPLKGKANQELLKFLSEILSVSKSRLTIEKGLTDRTKVVSIEGLTQEQALEKFSIFKNSLEIGN